MALPLHGSAAEAEAGLAAALQAALTRHPALAGKAAEVGEKNALVDAAKAQRYPSFSGTLAAQNNGTQPNTWRARQPLWAFGRIDSQVAYARADVQVEQADTLRVQRQLIEQTAMAYAKVQGLQQRAAVAADNTARHQDFLGLIERRQRGQLASLADVRLAASRLSQAQAQQDRIGGDLEVARSELLALTQVAIDTTPAAEAPPLARRRSDADLESAAVAASADMAVRARQVELAQADAEREKASVLPTVYLQYERNGGVPGYRTDGRVAVVLEGSVDGLGLAARGRSRAAAARLQAAQEGLNAARVDVLRNVRSLLAGRRLQAQLGGVQQQAVNELQDILASYQRQYEAGRKAWLDVLNVQRELTDQRLLQVQVDNDALTQALRLAAITGELDAPTLPAVAAPGLRRDPARALGGALPPTGEAGAVQQLGSSAVQRAVE